MSLYENTIYPQLDSVISAEELAAYFTPTAEEIDFAEKSTRSPSSRLTLLVLVKTFQKLHRFPEPDEIPDEIVRHVRIHLGLGEAVSLDNSSTFQRTRQRRVIRDYTGRLEWGQTARQLALTAGYEAALVMARQPDITNAIIGVLLQARYELPAFSTLQSITKHVRARAHRKTFRSVFRRLKAKERRALDRLLVVTVNEKRTALQMIKRAPRRASRKHLDKSVKHLNWLETLGSKGAALTAVAPSLVSEFAKQARAADAREFKDFTREKRYTLLVSLIHDAKSRTRDGVAKMVTHRVATIHKRAKDELENRQLEQRQVVYELLGKLEGVIDIADTSRSDQWVGRNVRSLLTKAHEMEHLRQECSTARNCSGNNYLPLLWKHYKNSRAVLFRAVDALTLRAASDDNSVLKAWGALRENNNRKHWIPAESVPLDFATKRWRTLFRHPTDPKLIDRQQLEICVLTYLRDHIEAGTVFVPGSESYADHRAALLPWSQCQKRLQEYCDSMGLPATADEFVDHMQRKLTEAAASVDRKFPQNTAITINAKGVPVLPKNKARQIPVSAQRLHIEIVKRMPERGILDVLVNVQHLTNFIRHFGPASGSETKLVRSAERYIVTIFAIGSNMGPVEAARHLQGLVTAHMLSFTKRKHITVEKLEAARRELVDFYLQLELPKAWGKGTSVGADGTQFDFWDNNLLVGQHFRYRKMGAVAYRHIADNYIAVFGSFVPPGVWEGIYVIEALQQARLSIPAENVCSDTQGQSAAVFAFALMFGIELLPRIRHWKDLILYRPQARARYRHINSLFRETVDWQRIRRHWKEWMQLILSVQAGKISSSTLIRQLSHRSEWNPLAQFAEELGRVERTRFLLEWISNQVLRQSVTAMTNKVESYHGFSKWLSFGGEVIAENDPDEQQKHIRCNDLLASAVILQNVIDMSKIIADLRREGWTIMEEDLTFLSPYLMGVKRFGEYLLDLDRDVEPGIQELLSRQGAPPRTLAKEA